MDEGRGVSTCKPCTGKEKDSRHPDRAEEAHWERDRKVWDGCGCSVVRLWNAERNCLRGCRFAHGYNCG